MRITCLVCAAWVLLASCAPSQEPAQANQDALEPAKFWTDLAGDLKLETWRRGLAIYLLYERHVKKDMTLDSLAEILNKPRWIRNEDVTQVTGIAGAIPLPPPKEGDSMFLIVLFRNANVERHNKECIGIYMIIEGELDGKAFRSIVLNREKSKYGNRKLKAWAISPTWNEYVKTIPR